MNAIQGVKNVICGAGREGYKIVALECGVMRNRVKSLGISKLVLTRLVPRLRIEMTQNSLRGNLKHLQ